MIPVSVRCSKRSGRASAHGSQTIFPRMQTSQRWVFQPPSDSPSNPLTLRDYTGIVCYFIYWTIQLPFMLVSPHKIRWLFLAKALIVPPSWLALLIWSFVKVPSSKGLFTLHATKTGSEFSWAYLSALNAALGFYATLAVNIPDFTVGTPSQSLSAPWILISMAPSDMRGTKNRKNYRLLNSERGRDADARLF